MEGQAEMAGGDSYEVLTQELFQTILDQTLVKSVEVQRNVWLQGKSTRHQIDVYWRFEVGGIIHETIIQAKDWNKRVDQGELLKFRGVLDDLPGQPRGVFVTRTGYQSGSEDVARIYGISLFQLEEAETRSLKFNVSTLGYVTASLHPAPLLEKGTNREGRTFVWRGIVYEPEFRGSKFTVDPAWLRERAAEGIAFNLAVEFEAKPNDVKFFDRDGKVVDDLHRIYKGFVTDLRGKEGSPHEVCHTFDEPTYIRVPDPDLPYLKTHSIISTVTINEVSRLEKPARLSNLVQFVLRNLTDGTERIYGTRPTSG